MLKNDGISRWTGYSQNKKMNDFMTKETPEQPQAIPVKEEEREAQQFELMENYHFEKSLQEDDFDSSKELADVTANGPQSVKNKSTEEADQGDNLVIHVYSNNVNQEELHVVPSEVREVVQPAVVVEKQPVKIVVANSFQAEPEATEQMAPESIESLKEEQATVPEQIKGLEIDPEEATKEPVVSTVDETAIRLMQELNAKIDKIESTYISRNFVEKQQEEIINSLHRELIDYKENVYKEQLKPFVKGIISIINSQYKRIRELSKQRTSEDLAIELVIEELKIVIEDLENLLYPYEIDRLNVKKGDVYNADIHKALTRIMTSKKDQDRTISSVLGLGYQWGSRVIEKASVVTFVYEGKEQGEEKI